MDSNHGQAIAGRMQLDSPNLETEAETKIIPPPGNQTPYEMGRLFEPWP